MTFFKPQLTLRFVFVYITLISGNTPAIWAQEQPLTVDVEERRLLKAATLLPRITPSATATTQALGQTIESASDFASLKAGITSVGSQLWQHATSSQEQPADDDRTLYWARLAGRVLIKLKAPSFPLMPEQKRELLALFELSSRGMMETVDSKEVLARALVIGFDPTFLHANIKNSNPSAAAALHLDRPKHSRQRCLSSFRSGDCPQALPRFQ